MAIELDDGHTYIIIVAIQKNLLTLMNNKKNDFLSPGDPVIIVRKLTKEIIEKAIEAYIDNKAYFLKFYTAKLDIKTLNVLKYRSIARSKFLDDLLEKDKSIDIQNYDFLDFDINNINEK